MARKVSFNFGASAAKPRKPKKSKSSGKGRGNKSNAWRAYVNGPPHSNAPIPD